MIQAKVIEDTIGPHGDRLVTLEVEFQRWVLAELNTHRSKSRNSASSRAIPVVKMLKRVVDDPAWPSVWGSEQKGMQSGPPLDGSELFEARRMFEDIHGYTTRRVQTYLDHNPVTEDGQRRLHKSLINRLLEPFAWHRAILTTNEWENFMEQRDDKGALPEMQLLARAMRDAMDASQPRGIGWGDWHLPYVTVEDWTAIYADETGVRRGYTTEEAVGLAKKISAARCARVSYLTHDGKRDISEDIRMFDETLMSASPKHWSPLEHVATPVRVLPDGWSDRKPGRSISGKEWWTLEKWRRTGKLELCFESGWGIYGVPRVLDGLTPTSQEFMVPGNFAPGWVQFRHAVVCS